MVGLQKGQAVRLEKGGGGAPAKVAMAPGRGVRKPEGLFGRLFGPVGDIDPDASSLLFDQRGEMVDSLGSRQLRSRDGSIAHSGDTLTGSGDGWSFRAVGECTRGRTFHDMRPAILAAI